MENQFSQERLYGLLVDYQVKYWSEFASKLISYGLMNTAKGILEEVAKMDPDKGLNDLAHTLLHTHEPGDNNIERARPMIERAIEIDPTIVCQHVTKSELLVLKGETYLAIESFENTSKTVAKWTETERNSCFDLLVRAPGLQGADIYRLHELIS